MLLAIVDDDVDLCNDMGRWVSTFARDNPGVGGVEFAFFHDSNGLFELLEKRDEQSEALVLLDLDIRGDKGAGISTLQKLKQSERAALRNLPVVIYSNTNDPEEVRDCYGEFANSYVWKGVGSKQKIRFLELMKFWTHTATVPQAT